MAAATPAAFGQTTPPDQSSPAALSAVYACSQIQDDHQRLACFDTAVGHLKQAETQGQIVAVDRERARTVERDAFGFNLPSLMRLLPNLGGGPHASGDSEINSISATVARLHAGPTGYLTFVLDNGQSWTEVEAADVNNIRVGDQVTIHRASMGSFRLTGTRGGQGYRVRRQD
jgi:hypothetical protein